MPEIDERIEVVAKAMEIASPTLSENPTALRAELRVGLAALDACDREHPKPFEDVMEAAKRWLEKVYPPDVPLVCDRDSPDPGPRLAAALRDCLEAQDVGAADSVAATDKKSVPSDREDAAPLRAAIRKALDLMAQATDSELGEGGVARRAYTVLYSAYFRSPSGPSHRDLLRALATELDAIDHTHDVSDLFDAGLLAQYRDITGEGVTGLTTKARDAIRAAINREDE